MPRENELKWRMKLFIENIWHLREYPHHCELRCGSGTYWRQWCRWLVLTMTCRCTLPKVLLTVQGALPGLTCATSNSIHALSWISASIRILSWLHAWVGYRTMRAQTASSTVALERNKSTFNIWQSNPIAVKQQCNTRRLCPCLATNNRATVRGCRCHQGA